MTQTTQPRSRQTSTTQAPKGQPKPPQIVQTWAFDSIGTRKYALQIRRASNGNPCLKIVEGVPQGDGTFRRFELTFWSEDFPRLFETLDQVRKYMADNNIKTPEGHKYDPIKKFKPKNGFRGGSQSGGARRGAQASGARRTAAPIASSA